MFRFVKRLKEKGISLRKINGILVVLTLLASITLFAVMERTTEVNQKTHDVTQKYFALRSAAYNMQIASDYLTEQIRCFAVTGEWQYLENYFTEAKETKRREHALETLEENLGKTKTLSDLEAAMDGSLELMNLEYYAGRLVVEGNDLVLAEAPQAIRDATLVPEDTKLSASEKLEKARALLFGEEYRAQKENISNHMQECLDDLMEEVGNEQARLAKKLREQVSTEHALTLVLIVFLLGTVILSAWTVFRPLRIAVNMIREEHEIPLKGAYEVRFLAKTYNLMLHSSLKNQEKLSYEATHDALTGLYNRRGYDFLIRNMDWETSALILFDLDDFKSENDTYGHDVGDLILKKAGDVIFKSFRSQDYVCRIGGDEFAVIMVHANVSMTGLIQKKIEHMNEVLEQGDDRIPPASMSVGVSFGHQDQEMVVLFKQADEALYQAKGQGKKGVCFYE